MAGTETTAETSDSSSTSSAAFRSSPASAKAIEHHDDFEQDADYEEVTPTQPDYGTMGAPQGQGEHKRQCPL